MTVTTDLGGRLAERGRARRRTRLTVTLSVTTLLALLGLAGWLLLGTGVLGVHDVAVTGTSRLDPAEVRRVAAIEAGTPLARLDTGAVADRLGRLPVVRTVEVERSWPRGVTIRVRERTAAAVQARGQAYALVDRDGVEFAQVQRRPAGLPLVSAPVDAGPPALRAALDVLDQLTGPVRDQVRQVRAATAEQVELRLTRGRTVLWGSTERGARKAAVLAVLISRKAQVYDVSAPDTPTTRS
jgi:cell division protein FtsQ